MSDNKRTCIIVDSSSSIKEGQIKDVYLLPLHISEKTPDGKEFEYLDSIDITTRDIMQKIKVGSDLKSSQTSIGEMYSMIEELQDQYDRFIIVPISKHISGSFGTWNIVKEDYSDLDIMVVDAEDIANGMEDIVKGILELANNNATNKEIEDFVNERKNRRYGILIVKDLSQLKKGGRISTIKALAATLLKLNILISFNGGLDFYNKTRDDNEAIEMVKTGIDEKINYRAKGIKKAYVFTTFIEESKNNEILEMVKKELNFDNVELGFFPGAIALHVGEGFAIYIEANE